jgi:type I restriction enzyme M protein
MERQRQGRLRHHQSPFGGYEDDGVGSDYPADLRTRETADMFMALIVKKLLKENGRAAVVLPDGFLFGDGIKGKLKKLLMRDCKLHTIVRLPKGVFAPYTTIKTNLLFFTKGAAVDDGTEHFHTDTIWFYEHPYPRVTRATARPSRSGWKSSSPSRTGGEARLTTLPTAWKANSLGRRTSKPSANRPKLPPSRIGSAPKLGNEAGALEGEAAICARAWSCTTDAKLPRAGGRRDRRTAPQAEPLRLQARDAQAAGDRIVLADLQPRHQEPQRAGRRNPRPGRVAGEIQKLLGEIEETENQLKSELVPHWRTTSARRQWQHEKPCRPRRTATAG